MKKLFLMAAMAAAPFFSINVYAQVPVTITSNIPGAIDQAANYAQYLEQVIQLKNQLTQAKAMFDSLNGARGMAALVNNPAARQYLPKTSQDIYALSLNSPGPFSGLSGSLATLKSAGAILSSTDVTNPMVAASLNKSQLQIANAQVTAEAAYNAAGTRFDTLQQLIDTVDTADPKAAADLSARIQAEQAMLQNETLKLNMLAQIQAGQDRLALQQGRENTAKMGKGTPVYISNY